MILQALYEYYHRKAASSEDEIAPIGFQYKEIPFLVVIDENGQFVHLEDTREGDGKKKRAKSFRVPQEIKRTSGVAANLLWDKPDYLLGYVDTEESKKKLKAEKAHTAFIEKITTLCSQEDLPQPLQAVQKFLSHVPLEQITNDPQWEEVKNSTNSFLTFKLKGQTKILCEMPEIFSLLKNYLQSNSSENAHTGYCLITGTEDDIALTHPVIKGVLGSQTSGANIVSFNLNAVCSYGKAQGENAPVGQQAATAYTTALNLLLGKDSKQRIQLSGSTVVFWAEKEEPQAVALEDSMAAIFIDDKDDPDRGKREMEALYHSPWTGKEVVKNAKNRFFVLGLSPNAARLAVRFWHVLSVSELEQNIKAHFDDLKMIHGPKDSGFLPLKRLIRELCAQHKLENAPPNLEGAFFESILLGVPYPLSVLQAVIRRIHAEQAGDYSPVNYPRAALLKAFLNRWYRRYDKRKEMTMSLDENNDGIGYCLGRLFAILEKIQEDASGISTVRERFYGSASSTPAIAFPQLLKLKNHHLAKMDSPGKVIYFEKMLGQVMKHFKDSFPTHLPLFEQGAFSVGYYHQRQAFFQKKEDKPDVQAELQTV